MVVPCLQHRNMSIVMGVAQQVCWSLDQSLRRISFRIFWLFGCKAHSFTMGPILVDKTVFLYLSEVHTLTRCVTERRFQQKILRIPLQDLSPSSPVNKNPPRGRIIVHNAFYNLSWLGWGRGGSTLAILRLTALYNFEPEEEYSKEPKEGEREMASEDPTPPPRSHQQA